MYFQQGDVLLKKVDKRPIGIRALKSDLLHKGQSHHHRVRGKFQVGTKKDQKYLISKGCEIFHEEHKAIKIPVGVYILGLVQEYDHWLEESRAVID